MGLTYRTYFPTVPKYFADLWIGSAGLATANIQIQLSSVSSSWDWYVNRTGWCYAYLYVDGVHVATSDVGTWGANGSGLNGVQSSRWVDFGNYKISKTSTVQLIIDCRLGPKIYGSAYGGAALGYLNSGAFTPDWASEISFLRPPVITSLYNNNKYNDQAGVSASTNSISIGARLGSSGDAATDWWYEFSESPNNWVKCSNPDTIHNLSEGISKTIKMRAQNGAGHSEYGWITIRTRYNKPVLTLNPPPDTQITNTMTFKWSSDKECQQIRYKYRNITKLEQINPNYTWEMGWSDYIYINLSGNPKHGEVIVTGLELHTKYEFQVSVLSIPGKDALWSDEIGMGVESVRPAFLIAPFEYEYGGFFNLIRNNPSGLGNVVEIYAKNSNTLITKMEFPKSEPNLGDQNFTIYEDSNYAESSLSEDSWDKVYMLLEDTSSTLDLLIKIGTVSNANDETKIIYEEYDGILTLTGNVRTIQLYTHGNYDKTKGWIYEQNSFVRGVAWVGDPSNKPQRSVIYDN